MRKRNVGIALIAVLIMITSLILAGCGGSGSGGAGADPESAMKGAAEYLVENVEVDSIDSMGGGWVPFALKMSGTDAADDD